MLSLPIAYHCLRAYGFRDFDRRTVVHSIAGCFFYGAFAAKLIVVRSRRLPGWALPVAGGTMVARVVVLWYSAALKAGVDDHVNQLRRDADDVVITRGPVMFSSPAFNKGGSYSAAFEKPGVYSYLWDGQAAQPAVPCGAG